MNPIRSCKGFTLMEVMITVAIIGVLATIAYPSYKEQIARGRRADAKAALLEAAQWMERQYTVSNRYDQKADLSTVDTAALTTAGLTGATGSISRYYTLSFADASGASAPSTGAFSLRMAPAGAMTGDRCGSFTVTNTGAKAVTSGTVADCWDR